MKMLYQRTGGPILSWASGYPPHQYRAAETTGLGEVAEYGTVLATTVKRTQRSGRMLMTPQNSLGLYEYVPDHPLPGAPEMIHGITDDLSNVQSMAGLAIGAYHGYKRTGSIGWAAGYGLAGMLAPLFTGIVAVAQGFAKPKGHGTGWFDKK